MDTPEIIDRLSNAELVPAEAIRAARLRKAELAPLFLALIEDSLAGRFDRDARPDLLFFAFHLLGEWRETAAYRPLLRLLRSASMRDAVDDAVPETCHRVIAAVFDGDAGPLREAVLDCRADEFVRARMCETLAVLTLAGKIPHADTAGFLRRCFSLFQAEERQEIKQSLWFPRGSCYVWSGWQSAIALLGLEELVPLVKEAFERELVDPSWLSFHHFEEDIRAARAGGFRPPDEFAPFDDAIEEFSHWYGFSAEAVEERKRAAARAAQRHQVLVPLNAEERAIVAAMPAAERNAFLAKLGRVLNNEEPIWQEQVVNPHRDVGRNDPCPCGSGAKFKKCCLAKAA